MKCDTCKTCFRTTKALQKHRHSNTHRRRAGDVQKTKDYTCNICGKSYFRKQSLQRHMRYHSGTRPYKCPHCDYWCQELTNLNRHKQLHFSQRDYVCELCGAAFHVKRTLETHLLYKHSDERNHICTQCSRAFKTANALARHLVIHRNTKSHRCAICDRGFNRQYNLRRHMINIHQTEDQYLPPTKKVKLLDVPAGEEYNKARRLHTPQIQRETAQKNSLARTNRPSPTNEAKKTFEPLIPAENSNVASIVMPAEPTMTTFMSDTPINSAPQVSQLPPDFFFQSPVAPFNCSTSLTTTMFGIPLDVTSAQVAHGLFPEIHQHYPTLSVDPVQPTTPDVNTELNNDYSTESYQFLHLMQAPPTS